MTKGQEFTGLSLAAVRAMAREEQVDFELYLAGKDSSTPVLYRRAGSDLAEPDFDRLTSTGVSRVFVRPDDFAQCEQAIENRLAEILANPQVEPGDKAELMHTVGGTVAQQLVAEPPSGDGIARTGQLLENMIQCVLHDVRVAEHLVQMAGHERSTASHMFFVSSLAVILGSAVFNEDETMLRDLAFAGMLHDLGKMSVPAELLNSTSPLSREQIEFIQQHPIESVRLVNDDPNVTQRARQMILQHHERVDGRGYPLGVADADLLPGSRVLSIVDSFHAMIGARSYRAKLTASEANRVLASQGGRQFDDQIVRTWQQVFKKHYDHCIATHDSETLSEADDVSTRHEHRPKVPPPKVIFNRPQRLPCHGRCLVRCYYAGRLHDATVAPEEFGALVHDISRTGMCIYASHPMYRGEAVNVEINLDGSASWLRTHVAWSRRQDANTFRVGLRFVERLVNSQARSPSGVISMKAPVSKPTAESAQLAAGDQDAQPQREPVRDRRQSALQTLAAIDCLRRPDMNAQNTAITLAMSGDIEVRIRAIQVLVNINSPGTQQALTSLLQDSHIQVREQAVAAVRELKLRRAADDLVELLNDTEPAIALRAAGALGVLGDRRGLQRVKRGLYTDGAESRLAAQALGDITGHRFRPNREGVREAQRYLEAQSKVLSRQG